MIFTDTSPPLATGISTTTCTLLTISTSSSRFSVRESMEYTETTKANSFTIGTTRSVISAPVVGTTDQNTGSNTLIIAVFSTVIILLVVTIVILIVSVLVCRRRASRDTPNTNADIPHQTTGTCTSYELYYDINVYCYH